MVMMAKKQSIIVLFLLAMLAGLVVSARARPLSVLEGVRSAAGLDGLVSGLVLGEAKNGGPSPGGAGPLSVLEGVRSAAGLDGLVSGLVLGEAKNGGPSPGGAGHSRLRGFDGLGGMKDSGPSPGVGH